MTKLVTPEEGFPPGSTVTWCPHCGEPIQVQARALLIPADVVEERIHSHFRLYHPIRWWLWQRFGWKRAISG